MFNKKYRKTKNTPQPSTRTKGDRMGWVSIDEAKSVSLESVLSEGELVNFQNKERALLVP